MYSMSRKVTLYEDKTSDNPTMRMNWTANMGSTQIVVTGKKPTRTR